MMGDQNGDMIVCFGKSWRSVVCRLDQFFDATLGVSFRPLCRWHDWLLSRQFDRDFEDAEPVELVTPADGIKIRRRSGPFIQTGPTATAGSGGSTTWTYLP